MINIFDCVYIFWNIKILNNPKIRIQFIDNMRQIPDTR